MDEAESTLLKALQSETRDGILYKCFCAEFGVRDMTPDELWDMFDVRWSALSEARLDKGLETFLMRDEIDSQPSTVQVAALDPAGHVVGGARVHIAPLELLGGFQAVQISRVGVTWVARGVGIGTYLVSKSLRIARALGAVKSLPLVFLLGRILDSADPNRVLKLYERVGFRRTNLYTVTKGLSNCLMLAGVGQPALQCLRRLGFQVEEVRERGAIYPTLIITGPIAHRVPMAERVEERKPEKAETDHKVATPLRRGRRVMIRHFTHKDLPQLHYWQHQYARPGYANVSQTAAPTMAELETAFRAESNSGVVKRFAVETVEGRLIGQLLCTNLRNDVRSICLNVLIGEPDFWNGGWGREAIRLLLEYLFDEMGIHRVSATVSQLQETLLHDLESLGFRHDGIVRDNEIVDGRYINHELLSILEDEYRQWQVGDSA